MLKMSLTIFPVQWWGKSVHSLLYLHHNLSSFFKKSKKISVSGNKIIIFWWYSTFFGQMVNFYSYDVGFYTMIGNIKQFWQQSSNLAEIDKNITLLVLSRVIVPIKQAYKGLDVLLQTFFKFQTKTLWISTEMFKFQIIFLTFKWNFWILSDYLRII